MARVAARAALACALGLALHAAAAESDLSSLTLEELGQVKVTSVSKRPEPLAHAAAAIYVITAEDIRRSGARTLAEALRLAPNLEVARVNSQAYTISSRGLNSVNASNKVLVLIDGRAIYTPFFTSVAWDQQDVMLDDIERIEVISGPGGTLWGANAMNGVINVITKRSADTQGALGVGGVGSLLDRGEGRWGGALGASGHYRAYALGFYQGNTALTNGVSAQDRWNGKQGGFRSDVAALGGALTVQGDIYDNRVDTPIASRNGGNLLANWTKELANGSSLRVQAYFDEQTRHDEGANGAYVLNRVRTFDVQAEHVWSVGAHQIVWGVGERSWRDRFENTVNPFVLVPASDTLYLTNLFAEDSIALRDDLSLTIGSKFEYSTFSQWAVMPNVRVGWQANRDNFVWGAISRAVRPPSRLERDLTAPGIVNLSPGFESEKMIAYEAGWRTQLPERATLSVSLFVDDYDDLRTTQPGPTGLPVTFGNGWQGHTYGSDIWGSYRLSSWWRVDAGVELLGKRFHLKPGTRDIAGIQTVLGHDPSHQVFLRSYVDLPHDMQLYVALRDIGHLPDVGVPHYTEADVRLAWRVRRDIELSIAGQNLLHARHAEATEPPIHEIPRSAYLEASIRF